MHPRVHILFPSNCNLEAKSKKQGLKCWKWWLEVGLGSPMGGRSGCLDDPRAEWTGEGGNESSEKGRSFRIGGNLWTMSFSWASVLPDSDLLRMTLSWRHSAPPTPSCPIGSLSYICRWKCLSSFQVLSSTSCTSNNFGSCLISSIFVSSEWKFPKEHFSNRDTHQFFLGHLTKLCISEIYCRPNTSKTWGRESQKFHLSDCFQASSLHTKTGELWPNGKRW